MPIYRRAPSGESITQLRRMSEQYRDRPRQDGLIEYDLAVGDKPAPIVPPEPVLAAADIERFGSLEPRLIHQHIAPGSDFPIGAFFDFDVGKEMTRARGRRFGVRQPGVK